jgi:hypothetical protein
MGSTSNHYGRSGGIILRIFGIALCFILLSAICAAEEAEYLDWKGSKLYASKNYTEALDYFNQATSQDQIIWTAGSIKAIPESFAGLRGISAVLQPCGADG